MKLHNFFKSFFAVSLIIGGFLFWSWPIGQARAADLTSCLAVCAEQSVFLKDTCEQGCYDQYGYAGLPDEDGSAGGLPATGVSGPATGVSGPADEPSGQSFAILPNFLGVSSINELVLKIIKFIIQLAIPFAVFMLIWSGFLFVTAQGNPEKITKAKHNFLWTVAGIFVILASDAIVGYVSEILGGPAGGGSVLVGKIEDLLGQIIGLLFVLVTVYFFWGVAEFVRASASGGKELEEGKKHMIWGLVGMAVMAGAWGIVAIVQSLL